MKTKTIHLVSNAHLDPTWLWEWEEGAAEAISTFRVAADMCEKSDGFVFNHNEAILYKWVEEYEPSLFNRIKELVEKGKWHIMGGWYLQPDCNMPSGESFVRQILAGRTYFKEKFGVEPTTAINFDPFGHSRGLVQILVKSGYDSYLFSRPDQSVCPLPSDNFIWVGCDGSEIMAHRSFKMYGSGRGHADSKVREWIKENKDKNTGLILWGVGNHGGGPSRLDLLNLNKLAEENDEFEIMHSYPENYFSDMKNNMDALPKYFKSLNPFAVGCYTSQVRLKQKHRLLENEIYMLEKMVSNACLQGYFSYPEDEIRQALNDLMFSEFHDVLPGSSIQKVEENSLRLMEHGLEIASRLKVRAFFALAGGQEKAKEGEIPILIYNPHPFRVKGIFECEFQLADVSFAKDFSYAVMSKDGIQIPCQMEKEASNIPLDWRKHAVFQAELEPGQMNRFNCRIGRIPEKPVSQVKQENGFITFKTEELLVVINCMTGLIDKYQVCGVDYLKGNAFCSLMMEDNDEAWEISFYKFDKIMGKFALMAKEEGTKFSGVRDQLLESVRVVEDGEVRTVVEAVLKCGDSYICQTYRLPKKGTEINIQIRVYWNEKSVMLKLLIPTLMEDGRYLGQTAYGVEELLSDGSEVVAQKWTGAISDSTGNALTCINESVYGSDFCNGDIRLSLLRSPGYSAHPIEDRTIMPQNRFSPRIDQGERLFNFWFNVGEAKERIERVDREALAHNEKPYALSFFPSGEGIKSEALLVLDDEVVQMTAFKKAEKTDNYIFRLYEPTGEERQTTVSLPAIGLNEQFKLNGFEVKTLRLDLKNRRLDEVNLMEESVN